MTMLDIFFFLLAVWICSSILTAGAIKAERIRSAEELRFLQEQSRQKRVDSLYGRNQDD